MRSEYVKLIAEQDKNLEMLREFWMGARDNGEKAKVRVRLDEALDERLRLMKIRDNIK